MPKDKKKAPSPYMGSHRGDRNLMLSMGAMLFAFSPILVMGALEKNNQLEDLRENPEQVTETFKAACLQEQAEIEIQKKIEQPEDTFTLRFNKNSEDTLACATEKAESRMSSYRTARNTFFGLALFTFLLGAYCGNEGRKSHKAHKNDNNTPKL